MKTALATPSGRDSCPNGHSRASSRAFLLTCSVLRLLCEDMPFACAHSWAPETQVINLQMVVLGRKTASVAGPVVDSCASLSVVQGSHAACTMAQCGEGRDVLIQLLEARWVSQLPCGWGARIPGVGGRWRPSLPFIQRRRRDRPASPQLKGNTSCKWIDLLCKSRFCSQGPYRFFRTWGPAVPSPHPPRAPWITAGKYLFLVQQCLPSSSMTGKCFLFPLSSKGDAFFRCALSVYPAWYIARFLFSLVTVLVFP